LTKPFRVSASVNCSRQQLISSTLAPDRMARLSKFSFPAYAICKATLAQGMLDGIQILVDPDQSIFSPAKS
jgi:hypothetical protein